MWREYIYRYIESAYIPVCRERVYTPVYRESIYTGIYREYIYRYIESAERIGTRSPEKVSQQSRTRAPAHSAPAGRVCALCASSVSALRKRERREEREEEANFTGVTTRLLPGVSTRLLHVCKSIILLHTYPTSMSDYPSFLGRILFLDRFFLWTDFFFFFCPTIRTSFPQN